MRLQLSEQCAATDTRLLGTLANPPLVGLQDRFQVLTFQFMKRGCHVLLKSFFDVNRVSL